MIQLQFYCDLSLCDLIGLILIAGKFIDKRCKKLKQLIYLTDCFMYIFLDISIFIFENILIMLLIYIRCVIFDMFPTCSIHHNKVLTLWQKSKTFAFVVKFRSAFY